MVGGEPQDATDDRGDDVTAVLVSRLRLAIVACVAPIIVFAIFDLDLEPQRLAFFYGLKLIALAILATAFVLISRRRERRSVVAVALSSALVVYGLSSASAIMAREPVTNPLLSISVALATATILPWGVAPQALLVAILAACTGLTIWMASGTAFALVAYPNVGVAVGLGLSVYVAYELERSRRALAQRERSQRRAQAEVRQLNQELERRVAERTAQLADVNQALAAEVSVRRGAEAALRRSQAALFALIANATEAVCGRSIASAGWLRSTLPVVSAWRSSACTCARTPPPAESRLP
jgi:hypothetical protein